MDLKKKSQDLEKESHNNVYTAFLAFLAALKKFEKGVKEEVNKFYESITKNGKVNYLNTFDKVSKTELKDIKKKLDFLKINANASKYNKLDKIKLDIKYLLSKLAVVEENSINNVIDKNIALNYYKNFYNLNEKPKVKLNIEKFKNANLNYQGKIFSERIWTVNKNFLEFLSENIEKTVKLGTHPDKTAQLFDMFLKDGIDKKKYAAKRLMRTEVARFNNLAASASYKAMGIDKYKILATLDTKTSDICQDKDGEVFDLEEFEVGETAPPFHPNCRTTTVPYLDKVNKGTRIARDEEGKNYYVDNKLTYKEWYEKYVLKKTDENDIIKDINKFNTKNDSKIFSFNDENLKFPKDENGLIKLIENELNIDNETAQGYYGALKAYTGEEYTDIRAYQQGKYKGDELEDIKQKANKLEEFLIKAPKWNDGTTYRGIGLTDEELSVYKKGYIFDMRGSTSWSCYESITEEFIEEVYPKQQVIFICETQRKGVFIRYFSEYIDEYEVLCSKEAKYKVLEVKEDLGRFYVYVEEIE